ncbi:MAG TPA: hypothetical protein ENH94_07380 [Phycisphaerales bacterium]|nr:hypothetical protein [Phycisphaerales bacterium]
MPKRNTILLIVLLGLLVSAGCEQERRPSSTPSGRKLDILSAYTASSVSIMGLTGIVPDEDNANRATLRVYVDVLDSEGVRIKAPGVFRFELYQFVPRSSNPMGKRLKLWEDIKLLDPVENNASWRDFLRAYQFDLDFEFGPVRPAGYVVQVMFTTTSGKRLYNNYHLKY